MVADRQVFLCSLCSLWLNFKAMRCATLAEVRFWAQDERQRQPPTNTDGQGPPELKKAVRATVRITVRTSVRASP